MTKNYRLLFHKTWDGHFQKLDASVQRGIFKKILQLQQDDNPVPARHLRHGLPYFVMEVGQYRVCFKRDESEKEIKLFFAGKHKDYEKWLMEQ
jgi:mRNA-degrading endonuclease RelE of RelBE toxin-antitoxin system